jgi:hypothetical protein
MVFPMVRSSPLLMQHAFLSTFSLLLFGCPALSNSAVSGVLPGDLAWPGDSLAAGAVLLQPANRCRRNSRLDQGPVVLQRSALPCPSGLSWNL